MSRTGFVFYTALVVVVVLLPDRAAYRFLAAVDRAADWIGGAKR